MLELLPHSTHISNYNWLLKHLSLLLSLCSMPHSTKAVYKYPHNLIWIWISLIALKNYFIFQSIS